MKTAFFYRTRNEYNEVVSSVKTLNLKKQEISRFRRPTLLHIYTRYLSNDSNKWNTSVPKKRAGTKKYIGIITGNTHQMKICDVQQEEFLKQIGVEPVPKIAGVSKYSGEKTTHPVTIKTHQEFRTITSVFNKRYGHGNWRIQGPSKLQQKLKTIDQHRELSSTNSYYFDDFNTVVNKYPNGIPVTLIVNEPNANIPKQLFKVVLKG